MSARLVALVSGAGTNMLAMMEACRDPSYGAQLVAVGADRPKAVGLAHASEAGLPTFVVRPEDHPDRDAWDRALTDRVAGFDPDLVLLLGFRRLVGRAFLERFQGRVLNTHNSLLPAFPGLHAPRDALAYGVKITGATLFIVDEGVDTGPIVAQVAVPVHDDDSVETLTERVKEAERAQLVDCVGRMVRDGWTVQGRKVTIP